LQGDTPIRLLLTGTPVLNRPIELWSPLDMLGYGEARFGGFFPFAKRYCGATKGRWGWDFSGATNIEELHQVLTFSGAMIRRRKEDVLTDLPAKRWAEQPINMNGHAAEYLKAEQDTIRWFSDLPRRKSRMLAEAGEEYDGTPELHLRMARHEYLDLYLRTQYEKSLRAEQLVRFEALKLAAWNAKSEGVIEWIENFLESGKKLIVFAHHIEVVNQLAERFAAPKIQGGMSSDQVEAGKNRFQNDPECKVIVCNLQAGGVGHTLTAASDVAFVEFPWTPALLDQAVDRAHRIGQTESVTGWLLTASAEEVEDTIDSEILRLLSRKRSVVNAITDGKPLEAEDFSVTEELAASYAGRR
jgi:SNF2 family DNA or RNA helicase